MQLRQKVLQTLKLLRGWPRGFVGWKTVDLRGMKITEEHKRHIIRENSKVVLEGRIPGFILYHEDGRVEHFGRLRAKGLANPSSGWRELARSAFSFMKPIDEEMQEGEGAFRPI